MRMPVSISPGLGLVVGLVVVILLVALGVAALAGELIGQGARLGLRLTGHRPPPKTPMRMAIDRFEEEARAAARRTAGPEDRGGSARRGPGGGRGRSIR